MGEILDYVQIMSYDLRGGFQVLTGHHTNLFSYQTDLSDQSAGQGGKAVPRGGRSPGKTGAGRGVLLAANGRRYEQGQQRPLPDGIHHRLHTHHYGELLESYINKNGYVRYWDDEAKAPYTVTARTLSIDDDKSLSPGKSLPEGKGAGRNHVLGTAATAPIR